MCLIQSQERDQHDADQPRPRFSVNSVSGRHPSRVRSGDNASESSNGSGSNDSTARAYMHAGARIGQQLWRIDDVDTPVEKRVDAVSKIAALKAGLGSTAPPGTTIKPDRRTKPAPGQRSRLPTYTLAGMGSRRPENGSNGSFSTAQSGPQR